jgi:hypothetical protein
MAANLAISPRGNTERIAESPDVDIRKEALNAPTSPLEMLELRLVTPFPVAFRPDRLLATELKLSRAHVEELAASGLLRISTAGVRAFRRHVRDQTIVQIGISGLGDEFDIKAGGWLRLSAVLIFEAMTPSRRYSRRRDGGSRR